MLRSRLLLRLSPAHEARAAGEPLLGALRALLPLTRKRLGRVRLNGRERRALAESLEDVAVTSAEDVRVVWDHIDAVAPHLLLGGIDSVTFASKLRRLSDDELLSYIEGRGAPQRL